MRKFYITFGCGDSRSGYVVEVRASDYEDATAIAFEVLGTRWAFMYPSLELVDELDKCKGLLKTIGRAGTL